MADGKHSECVDATVAILIGLNLPRIGANVSREMLEQPASQDYPRLVCSIEGQMIPVRNLTSGSRLVEYPVKVKTVDRVYPPAPEVLGEWTGWMEAILDAFPDRKSAKYPAGIHGCQVHSRVTIEAQGRAFHLADGEWLLLYQGVRAI